MKDTLIEIKNNLQGINRVEEAKNQINDLEYKEPKNNQSVKTRRKKNPKNEDSVGSLWENFKHSNSHHRSSRRRRERARYWNSI